MEGRTYVHNRSDLQALPKSSISHLKPIFGYLRPYGKEMAVVLLALVIAASAVLSIGTGLRYLIDEAFVNDNAKYLDIGLLVLFAIIVVLAVASYFRFYFITKIGESVVADIRRDVFRHIMKMPPGFFEVTKVGEVLSRLTTDTSVIQLVVGSSLSVALRNCIMLAGGLTMLVITSPRLSAIIAIVVPLVVLQIVRMAKKVRTLSRASQDRVAEVSSHGEETLSAIKIVQAYGREQYEFSRFSGFVGEAFNAALLRVKMRAKLTSLVILLVFGAIGLVLWLGGKDVLSGALTAGQLSSFIFYSVLVAGATGAISEVIGDVQRAAGAAERLMELLHMESNLPVQSNPVPLPDPLKGAIKFENVLFSYPARPDTAALNHINFEVKPGETVALVGPSGAGKSTILQLLLRFYDPQQGRILVGGVDVKLCDPEALRSHCALVPQEAFVFSDTAYENIRYAKPAATQQEIEEAARIANAYDFIKKLPQGFDTYLGEKGVRLSGGERQRVALARAVLRQPKILLLDEATNALDAESELLVQQALEKVMARCTTVVIAHRLATILKSDKIIVVNGGMIEAMGTHAELVKQGSLYQRLAELQFSV